MIMTYKNKKYCSIKSMCQEYGVSYGTFKNRIDRGMSIETALTTPVRTRHTGSTECYDEKGNKFKTKKEMYSYYGTSKSTVRRKIEAGASLQDALEYQPRGKVKSEERIGETLPQTCGLKAKVAKCETKGRFTIIFEDGTILYDVAYSDLKKGHVCHPTLRTVGKGSFMGFKTKFFCNIADINTAFYFCTCDACGDQRILSPQEMMSGCDYCKQHNK